MTLDWNRRFEQQAQWTRELRSYLYKQAKIRRGQKVLDLGCGTGVLAPELMEQGLVSFGLDLDLNALIFSGANHPGFHLTQGNAFDLPFSSKIFDSSLCHFVIMWLPDPVKALTEMVRVTKKGGKILVFAEPDYGGRIDYPDELAVMGKVQIDSLIRQGADPYAGRKLAWICKEAGLVDVNTGVLGGQWSGEPDWESWESEWQVFITDMGNLSNQELDLPKLRKTDQQARSDGYRILFVPTFFAWGTVK